MMPILLPRRFLPLVFVFVFGFACTFSAQAARLNVIYNFTSSNNGGIYPAGSLVQGSDGNFYGTTNGGSGSTGGTVFKMTPTGGLTTLVAFNGSNGAQPSAALVQGSDGNFYGTTLIGGISNEGTVFKMTPTGILTTLVSFNGANGANPQAALVQGNDGNFYGTTSSGSDANAGTVFQITPDGVLTTLVAFSGANGEQPFAGLVQGNDGNFYGTTYYGGSDGKGTVFRMTPEGVLTTLVSFNGTNGAQPSAALVQGSDGNFYGTTEYNEGTVFKMTPDGTLTTLVSFNYTNGAIPESLVQGSDGNFCGATEYGGSANEGTVFQMTPDGILTTLASFNYTNGAIPGSLVQGSDGNFYGMANEGGTAGEGVVFQLTLLPQVATPTFSPEAGTYTSAQSVTISTATSAASIRYTTDGSTPSETTGIIYTGVPVSINSTTNLQAIAYETGIIDSPVTRGTYMIVPLAPVFSPAAGTYANAQNVTMTSATSGALIRYTTDGSTPSETNGALYSGSVTITVNTTLQAIAYDDAHDDSSITSANYSIAPVPAPTFSPSGGTYTTTQSVTITDDFGFASVRYTTDGNTPTENYGTLYSGPVTISSPTTLKAIAYADGHNDSPVTSSFYAFPPAPAPVFSPAPGTYASAQIVAMTSAASIATIRYTTDGSTPTETNGTIYSGPVTISNSIMLKAIAYGSDFADSPVTSGLYTIIASSATSINVIHNFTGFDGGGGPTAALVQGSDGNFYGTTAFGGNGTIFKITPTGTFTPLVSFNGTNGAQPSAALVQGGDGNFYGTTSFGGSGSNGTVFKMTPTGVLTTLVSFNGTNGTQPFAALVQGSDGNFYGTTRYSSIPFNLQGTIFRMTPAGILTTLISFNGANGGQPNTLISSSDGNFYGTCQSSGLGGMFFKMTPAGILTGGPSFNLASGIKPVAALAQGRDGNFYGTATEGGNGNLGTIFTTTPSSPGPLITLISFNGSNGADPEAALVQGSDGNFYGTTKSGGSSNKGTIFKITPAGVLTTLISFDGANGANPEAALVQGRDGNLYGTAYSGGTSNQGVIFQLILPPPPQAVAPVFSPTPGTYTSAQTLTITSATSGATIRYTTDGSTPTEANGTIYSSPVTISITTNLQAIAYGTGLSDSTMTSGTYTISRPIPSWALRDFNGDGQPDILWHNATTGDVAVWTMNGTSVTGASFIANIGAPWSIVGVGDFNQDGNADILWRNGTTGEIGVTLMSGTTITSYVGLGALDPAWTVAGLGDFNGDGQTDVFLDNTTTGEVGFWALDGTTVTGYISIGTLPSPWTIVGVGDFNGDGKSDLLWYNPTTGDLIVSLMDGATATDFEPVGNLPLPWTVAGLADFNGDGSVDILLRNATTGDTGLFLMNGTTPASFVPLGNVPAPWQPSD